MTTLDCTTYERSIHAARNTLQASHAATANGTYFDMDDLLGALDGLVLSVRYPRWGQYFEKRWALLPSEVQKGCAQALAGELQDRFEAAFAVERASCVTDEDVIAAVMLAEMPVKPDGGSYDKRA